MFLAVFHAAFLILSQVRIIVSFIADAHLVGCDDIAYRVNRVLVNWSRILQDIPKCCVSGVTEDWDEIGPN